MREIWTIAKRELASFFDSLIAYIMIGLFLGFTGFFTWIYGGADVFFTGQASLGIFFNVASWTLFFFIPAITMRMLAEEKRSGTLEMLLTKNVNERQVVLGKYLATLMLIAIALAATLVYPVTLSFLGDLDNGGTICGYLALFLMSMMYAAIGLLASSLTSNQIVSILVALVMGLLFHIIFGVLSNGTTGFLANMFNALNLQAHFFSLSRGVLQSGDILYFVTFSVIALLLTEISLMDNKTVLRVLSLLILGPLWMGIHKKGRSTGNRFASNKNNIRLILVIGIFIMLNMLSSYYYFKLDLTEDNQYTLSKATREILESVEEPITVKAYFSEKLPPQILTTRHDFKAMLKEYNRLSGKNVIYEFIDPNKDDETKQEATKAGVLPLSIGVREGDETRNIDAFMGAVLEMGEQKEVLPVIQPGMAMEYNLSKTIKKMAVVDKPTIGIVQGHGEPPLQKLADVYAELSVLYFIEPYNLSDSLPVPARFTTLAIIAPEDSFSTGQLQQLDQYVQNGGNVFVAINRVTGDFERLQGASVSTGLENWLMQKGVQVENSFLIDDMSGSVNVMQQIGGFQLPTTKKFPFFPIITSFAEHPVTEDLEAMHLSFASPISFTGDSAQYFTPVAFSSNKCGTISPPVYFDINQDWGSRYTGKGLPVAGFLSIPGEGKVFVVGDGDFPVGGGRGEQNNARMMDNKNLMVNAVDWLGDNTGLVELRNKGIAYRPLEDVKEGMKAFLKWFNFLFPIIVMIVFGLGRMEFNKSIRFKRMEESYE